MSNVKANTGKLKRDKYTWLDKSETKQTSVKLGDEVKLIMLEQVCNIQKYLCFRTFFQFSFYQSLLKKKILI